MGITVHSGRIACFAACVVFGMTTALAQSPASLKMIENLQNLRFDQLGNPQIQSNSLTPVKSTIDKPHRILIIPVQYSNRRFDRFSGEADADRKNQEYIQDLLFSDDLDNPKTDTLTHYYYHQSRGRYLVTGEVFPLVTVDKPSEYYGEPIQNSDGTWRNDVRSEELVEDALAAAYALQPDFPWAEFDVWDPLDYDGDKVFAEPDGYIDHFVLMYAGNGQSSCQGLYNLGLKFTVDAPSNQYELLQAQEQECAQRIWAHRSYHTANNGKGPMVEGFMNRRGGVPLREGLWVLESARYWREIWEVFPEAPVIMTLRDPESWFASVQKTILPSMRGHADMEEGPSRRRSTMAYELIVRQTFAERMDDFDHATKVYRDYVEDVRRSVPAGRLLEYDVKQGWEPLCEFLGVEDCWQLLPYKM